MDESMKRKERLKAMREEASTAVASTSVSPGCLSNPFVENSSNFPVQDSAPRFDFYTDPMAAYSGNRKSHAGYQQLGGHSAAPRPSSHMPWTTPLYPPGIGNSETNPTHAPQFHTNYLPNQRIHHPPPSYQGPRPHVDPSGMQRPLPIPNVGQFGTPSFSSGQGRGHSYARGPSPGPHPRPGMDQWHGNNMSPRPGRGDAHPNSGIGRDVGSPGSGRGSGRGRGSHDHVTAQDRPDRFYHKSMVEDPWKFLEPVLWTQEDISRSWLPKSISGTKKARVSESSSQSSSQFSLAKFSLAEYLASSFNDAVNESDT